MINVVVMVIYSLVNVKMSKTAKSIVGVERAVVTPLFIAMRPQHADWNAPGNGVAMEPPSDAVRLNVVYYALEFTHATGSKL